MSKIIGSWSIPDNVLEAIVTASTLTNINTYYLLAMCASESSFNPNAKAQTSSASGLYQFINSTWVYMINAYGKDYNISIDQVFDPKANALMGAFFAKENYDFLNNKLNREISNSELYLAHFLGKNGALKLLKANLDSSSVDTMGIIVANANRSVFFSKDGSEKKVSDVIQWSKNRIDPLVELFKSNLS